MSPSTYPAPPRRPPPARAWGTKETSLLQLLGILRHSLYNLRLSTLPLDPARHCPGRAGRAGSCPGPAPAAAAAGQRRPAHWQWTCDPGPAVGGASDQWQLELNLKSRTAERYTYFIVVLCSKDTPAAGPAAWPAGPWQSDYGHRDWHRDYCQSDPESESTAAVRVLAATRRARPGGTQACGSIPPASHRRGPGPGASDPIMTWRVARAAPARCRQWAGPSPGRCRRRQLDLPLVARGRGMPQCSGWRHAGGIRVPGRSS
jgi:hypothetical protein